MGVTFFFFWGIVQLLVAWARNNMALVAFDVLALYIGLIWVLFTRDFVEIPKGKRLLAYYREHYRDVKVDVIRRPLWGLFPGVAVHTRRHDLIPLTEDEVAYENDHIVDLRLWDSSSKTDTAIPVSIHLTITSGALVKLARRDQDWRNHLWIYLERASSGFGITTEEVLHGEGLRYIGNRIAMTINERDSHEDPRGFFLNNTGINAVVTIQPEKAEGR